MIRLTDELRDRELEQRVRTFLAGHNVPSLRRLAIEARDGTVTLQGRVATFYEKQLSQQCKRRVTACDDSSTRWSSSEPNHRIHAHGTRSRQSSE
jgi:hypothetical protein